MRKFKVLEKDGYDGLTISNRVLKSGGIFIEKECDYETDVLDDLIEDKRIEEIKEEKQKKEDKKADSK